MQRHPHQRPNLANASVNLLPFDGEARYVENFFSDHDARLFFQILKDKVQWKQEPIKMFGRMLMQPRMTALLGDVTKPYRYSGISMTPHSWIEELLPMKNEIERHTMSIFSSALANYYRNQFDSMGWHRDNEKELGPNPLIASVSFGAHRTFYFRHVNDAKQKVAVELGHGSLLVMSGSTQNFWQHSLPKCKEPKGPRINLTFRTIR